MKAAPRPRARPLRAASIVVLWALLSPAAGHRAPEGADGSDRGPLAVGNPSLLEEQRGRSAAEDGLAAAFEAEGGRLGSAAGGKDFSPACCCAKIPAEKCEYLVVEEKKKRSCCRWALDGCAFLSKWWTSKLDLCVGDSVPLPSRIRAHENWDLLDPQAFPGAAVVPPQGSRVEPLGEGGFGSVYLARDRRTREVRALKMAKNDRAAARLMSELGIAQGVHKRLALGGEAAANASGSRHLMRSFEVDNWFRPPFLALEYAGGLPWGRLASADYNSTSGLLKQVFLGLYAMDKSRPPTVHHDMKWDNVVVAEDGCLKIIDFDTAMAGVKWALYDAASTPYTKGYSLSGAVECGPERNGRCLLAYSYDAYSAGIMAKGSLCGLAEWGAFYKAQEQPAETKHQVEETMRTFHLDEHAAVYKLGFMSAAGHYGRKLSMADQIQMMQQHRVPHPGTVSAEGLGWFTKGVAGLVHQAFESKLAFCESLLSAAGPDALDILDRLVRTKAAERPWPGKVLKSRLFRDVATGCAGDD